VGPGAIRDLIARLDKKKDFVQREKIAVQKVRKDRASLQYGIARDWQATMDYSSDKGWHKRKISADDPAGRVAAVKAILDRAEEEKQFMAFAKMMKKANPPGRK
jgi:hypothetical protein